MTKIDKLPPAILKSGEQVQSRCIDIEDADDAADFKPMTAQEAVEWRRSQVSVSVWRVVGWQFAGVVVAGVVAYMLSGSAAAGWSAAYGGLAVGVPSAVMAWGMSVGRLTRLLSVFARGSLAALMFWEGVKVLLAVAMMALAPVLVRDLSWLAFVAGLVFVLKIYWVALLMLSRVAR